MANGFIISAPHSGSGKTTITLGLLRALKRQGVAVGTAKAGPDFIDPAFHSIAAGGDCINLDPWAMRPELVAGLASSLSNKSMLVVEAMMGLFDGAADGTGSAADLALQLGLPVVLVVDAAKQSHSIAALVSGFANHRKELNVIGVILNRVGSKRHELMLREALAEISISVIGAVPRDEKLSLSSRHLGLVQAGEHGDLEQFIEQAADVMESNLDLEVLKKLTCKIPYCDNVSSITPPAQNISIARDEAFAFIYPHLLKGWQEQGASLSFFSPLINEAPRDDCQFVFLPGGYPELHGGRLSGNSTFLNGLRDVAERGVFIYGECGGYMVLGEVLVDGNGHRHKMANLLPLETSFEKRKLHLGYRLAKVLEDIPFAPKGAELTAHEFHYTSAVKEGEGERLFHAEDARGETLGTCGLRRNTVAGSYLHIIDQQN